MTPHAFIEKWRDASDERAASQPHFIDLCRMLGQPDPQMADPKREWFCFERGAAKAGGGSGWADVWKRGHFGWEYKSRGRSLEDAHRQLLTYSGALENPPLLILCDFARYSIRTNWTNTVQAAHDFRHEDLADAAVRDKLLWAFTDPDRLKPAKTRAQLTEEAAGTFAALASRLRGRGHDAQAAAHFVNRLVFCMFAEDIGLLPNKLFQKAMERSEGQPAKAESYLRSLFAAMRAGGEFGLDEIPWFNGGLFDDDAAFPLERADVVDVLAAARLDWSDIDPAILGTLFERGLDPDKRSQLGAHYTDRDKIMLIVEPVIIRPLLAEWAATKAEMIAALPAAQAARGDGKVARAARERPGALRDGFLDRLAAFRVLDPACGSGNFLYLALLALKDIEHRANLEAEALGLQRGFPRIGPECVLGIELNPFAAELARVSVWIGDIQWMRRNGFEASRNPILRPLDTIECRDAVLNPDGTRADWPRADVVVGNPPFLGVHKKLSELGVEYTASLFNAWPEVPGSADLVCYWFAKAWEMMQASRVGLVGLVATNSIRGGANRVVLKSIVEGARIFEAWSDEAWTVEGAAVRVSLVCFDKANNGWVRLDGVDVSRIYSNLTASDIGVDLTISQPLPHNTRIAYLGTKKGGPFDLNADQARSLLTRPLNPNGRPNSDVLHRRFTGTDLARRPEDRWIIDFGHDTDQPRAMLYEAPFEYVLRFVKPVRDLNRREWRRKHFWLHSETAPGLRAAITKLTRYIGTPRVSKYRLFCWLAPTASLDDGAIAIARDDDTTFGVLHARFHELWSLRMGTFLGVGNDPRYTPSTTFETFPFPQGLTPNIPAAAYADDPRAQAIAAAAARLNDLREAWLNPPDLIRREPEVVAGYPDRILPVDDAAAAVLKTRTLTNLYNARPAWLDHAHRALDGAVAEAYGWGEDWRAGRLGDEEILARLFRLNQQRAAAQG